MTNMNYKHPKHVILDLVDHPILPYTNPVQIDLALELHDTGWTRIFA